MNEIILLKLGEMVLKGLNRRSFEDKLQANIHRRIHPYGQFRVYTRQSATYVEPKDGGCDVLGAYEALKKVFGIASLSLARPCEKDKDAILATAKEFLDADLRAARTFKVETKRADKTFPMTSIQLSQYVGGELHEAYGNLEVDVHHPELTVFLEVRDYAAYVHAQAQPGAGGLPVGINGRAVSLMSGGIDSPVASWMIAKRGVALDMVHFFSYPYTSPEAKEKVLELARLLTPWTGRLTVHVVPFTAIQEELRRSCPEELFTVPHAPVYDAHCPGGGQAVRGQGPGHRRVPGPGGQPDHGGHAGHRGGGGPARPAPLHRYGQGGDRSDCPEDWHL